ncbi:MAG: hypothetical protein SOX26_07435 [Phocaeicola sp.]|nr:hypothetical protein [Phocaeicola sp.]
MVKSIQIFITVILTSLFFFPFFFSFLPTINTKMMLAVLGLMVYFMDHFNGKTTLFEKRLFNVSVGALGVSFCSFLSMTINGTPDNSYLGYIMSMLVWLFAAYFCVNLMRRIHGEISVEIVGYYLLGVALLQCTLALLISLLPWLSNIVDSYITGEKYMGVNVDDRLHGIGCALDVGGGRLGSILIITIYLILESMKSGRSKWKFVGLLLSFFYILVIGCMIGRTTSVGALVAIVYAGYSLFIRNDMNNNSYGSYTLLTVVTLCMSIVFCTILYHTSSEAMNFLRFGFEGFFNYFENGKFETNSTNMLSEGMIFPDNWQTWIIGDGYMASGSNDPYYIGPSDYGFYMNTDAGYSRFIFYFGLTGLSAFILFFVTVCRECCKINMGKLLFIAILIFNLTVWVKVSTDLFLVFAPFLCILERSEKDCSVNVKN